MSSPLCRESNEDDIVSNDSYVSKDDMIFELEEEIKKLKDNTKFLDIAYKFCGALCVRSSKYLYFGLRYLFAL